MILPARESPYLPPNPPVDLHHHGEVPDGRVLAQGDGVEGGDRDFRASHERGPHVRLLVALVGRRERRREGDLLVPVGDVEVEVVVIDPDPAVGVVGGDGDVEARGEDVGDGSVEGVDGHVLEDEPGLVGVEDGVDEEYG